MLSHFYPRTPCGVRLGEGWGDEFGRIFLSTYPVRGTTVTGATLEMFCINFYPRTPCGVRRKAREAREEAKEFLSTYPVRGTTRACRNTPRPTTAFLSTYPVRGTTTWPFPFFVVWRVFLSTYPVRGTTNEAATVSTVATNFYPRTPCGVRPQPSSCSRWPGYFYPRTPCGVRPLEARLNELAAVISIHVPRAGYDQKILHFSLCTRGISIHVPRAGYDVISDEGKLWLIISIHVPRAGYDVGYHQANNALQ